MASYDPINGQDLGDGRIKTPVFRVSFPHLFKASRFRDGTGEPKFSLNMLFPKKLTLAVMRNAAIAAITSEWSADKKRWPGELSRVDLATYISGNGKPWPLRDGDLQSYDGYAGVISVVTGAREDFGPPMCLLRNGRQATEEDLYAGCYALAIVNPYTWSHPTGKGVSFGLQGIQKWADGEKFGARRVSPDDFESYDDAEDAGAYDQASSSDW